MPAIYCPRCKTKFGEYAKGTVETVSGSCPSCRGIVAGQKLLRNIIDAKLVKWFWELAEGSDPSVSARCSCCQKYLRQAVIQTQSGAVELDGCLSCRLIWFDSSETNAVFIESMKRDDPVRTLKESALSHIE